MSPHESAIIEAARPYTMTSPPRLLATVDAVTHVISRGVPGALVECGVWKGGSALAMIKTLQHYGVSDRDVFLYDTFEGMTAPTEKDRSRFDEPALETWKRERAAGRQPWSWAFDPGVFDRAGVEQLLVGTGYPAERIHLVVGPVESTIPSTIPVGIAVLRLDTDWFESTRHELTHLYPRIATGGVLINDDYGHWEGARAAVDEYFVACPPRPLLSRIDYTGRMGIKEG
jgi:hypothetical protein